MKALILLSVLLISGGAIGAGAAWLTMRFAPEAKAVANAQATADPAVHPQDEAALGGLPVSSGILPGADYQRLDDPFLVPLVRNNMVEAMMVLTLGIEVTPGQSQLIHSQEPRLRNQLLQALFDHANTGGFDGMFTVSGNMRTLRESLTRAARDVLGDAVGSILILDMVRQEA